MVKASDTLGSSPVLLNRSTTSLTSFFHHSPKHFFIKVYTFCSVKKSIYYMLCFVLYQKLKGFRDPILEKEGMLGGEDTQK